MKKQAFIQWAIKLGWELDKFGHLKRTMNGKLHRYKLSSVAVRYEVRTNSKPASWVRLRSGYFSKLSINDEGKLVGLTR